MTPEQIEALRTQFEAELKAQYLGGLSTGFFTCATAIMSILAAPGQGEGPGEERTKPLTPEATVEKVRQFCQHHINTLQDSLPKQADA